MKELLGKVIKSARVNDDQSVLVFNTDDGDMVYQTEAECCSETWFSDILNLSNVIGNKITNVRWLELDDAGENNRSRQQYDRVYGFALDSEKGACEVIFRNSSNGYYGGSAGLVTLPIPKSMELTIINTDDWKS